MTKPVYIVLPLALYLRQIRFVVQRILFLQKFCSLYNFLCTFNFFQIRNDCSLQISCSPLKVKLQKLRHVWKTNVKKELKWKKKWNTLNLFCEELSFFFQNSYFNFSTEDFLMHRSYIRGNYDCEPLLGVYPDSQLGSSLHLALGHVLKFIQ